MKDKDHIEFLCELFEAQVARGRYFVHELTSEVNSRMYCVAKIMAIPGTRATAADLCMFGQQEQKIESRAKRIGNLMHHDEQELLSVWEG